MLVYIIDGFNVVHKITTVRNSNTPRIDLIRYIKINKLTGSVNNKVIIVFDGWMNFNDPIEKGQFQVIFSQDESADEVIKRKVANSKNKKQIV